MPSDTDRPSPSDRLSASEHAKYLPEIIEDFLASIPRAAAPRCYLLGGQPGAGKTGLRKAIEAALGDVKPVLVDPDDLRIYHPHYVDFVNEDAATAASRTQPDANLWADELRMEALKRGVNVIVDTTLRDAAWAVTMAEHAHAADGGYAVEVHVVAVPFEVSRQGVRGRLEASFAAQDDPAIDDDDDDDERPLPRDVPPEYQRFAYDGLPGALEALSKSELVARIRVATRDGRALEDIHDQSEMKQAADADPNRFAAVLLSERDRPWNAEEIKSYKERAQTILSQMEARLAKTAGPAHDKLAKELEAERAEMTRVAAEQAARLAASVAWVRDVLECEPGGSLS